MWRLIMVTRLEILALVAIALFMSLLSGCGTLPEVEQSMTPVYPNSQKTVRALKNNAEAISAACSGTKTEIYTAEGVGLVVSIEGPLSKVLKCRKAVDAAVEGEE
jgi:hypothetical protein